MRRPFYPTTPEDAQHYKWYMKDSPTGKPHGVTPKMRNMESGIGSAVNHTDTRLAPTGVSVIFASYEPQ